MQDQYRKFIAISKYSRWLDTEQRREQWDETVTRYCKYIKKTASDRGYQMTDDEYNSVYTNILDQNVMPSMRALATAGPALDGDNIAGYNCAYCIIDNQRIFSEIMYVLMNGAGVGFSVERQYINRLPIIPSVLTKSNIITIVEDSRLGWAKSYQELIDNLYIGIIIGWDVSKVRPKGTRLKTFGGTASGPSYLVNLMDYTIKVFTKAAGRRLESLECHDLCCMIADVVVSGGVRRCIRSGSRVLVVNDDNNISFNEIQYVNTGDKVITNSGIKRVTAIFNQGMQKCIRISHQDGYLDCTPNHRIAIAEPLVSSDVKIRWINANELTPDHYLVTPNINNIIKSNKPAINTYKMHYSDNINNIPELDCELAWLIGYIHYTNITIPATGPTILISSNSYTRRMLIKQLHRFNIDIELYDNFNDKYCKIRIDDDHKLEQYLCQYTYRFISNKKSSDRKVPRYIKYANMYVKAAYLQGIIDKIDRKDMHILFSNKHKNFARDIQSLFTSCGVNTVLNISDMANVFINMDTIYDYKQFTVLTDGIGHIKYTLNSTDHAFMFNNLEHKYTPFILKKVVSIIPLKHNYRTYDIEVEDNHCFVCENILVHNSALLSLSNLSDLRMRDCKSGEWWNIYPYRALANNSACYSEKPNIAIFMDEFINLYKSKSGERGIFSREACNNIVASNNRRDSHPDFGCNPCVTNDTWIATNQGYKQVSQLINKNDFKIVLHGKQYPLESNGFFKTGNKKIYQLICDNGMTLTATGNHPIKTKYDGWVNMEHIQPDTYIYINHESYEWAGIGGTYEDGFNYGSYLETQYTNTILNTIEQSSLPCYIGFISASYCTKFIINNRTRRLSIKSTNKCFIALLQRMLIRIGIVTYTNIYKTINKGVYKLAVYDNISIYHLQYMINNRKVYQRNQAICMLVDKVVDIQQHKDVYDVTVADIHSFSANNIVVHNCSEVILRPQQFCNLSEVIVRSDDTKESLLNKIRIATIIGTIQASWTNFKYINDNWRKNCQEEALLGVSMSGIMDNTLTSCINDDMPQLLTSFKNEAIRVNAIWANRISISASKAITNIKPSGTVSQLVDCASGIHPRYAPFYIRRVRCNVNDPITNFMKSKNIPYEQDMFNNNTIIFSFPIKAPDNAIFRHEIGAIDHLNLWLMYQKYYCEHKPSVTIMVRDDPCEWFHVAAWIYDNFDVMSGVAFLPYDTGIYKQAPYEEISAERYYQLLKEMPVIDWKELQKFERIDNVKIERQWACTGISCEL